MRFAAAMALLLLIGLLLQASLLVYAAYALIAVFYVSRLLTTRWIDGISAKREMVVSEIEVGDSVPIGVQMVNRSGWFVPWMLIEDVLPLRAIKVPPFAIEVQGNPLRLLMLRGRSSKLVTYALKLKRRGYYQIGPTIGETGDLLGLHRRYRVLTPPQFLLVLPKVILLSGYTLSSKRPVGEIQVSYRLMEDPTLIAGIREYERGDALNRVHWKATARTGKLHSKIFQPTCVAGAMLVLDLHKDSNPDRHEPVRCDLAVTAAVSICHTLFQMQQQFGLVSNGRDAADRIRKEGWASDHRSREEALKSVVMTEEDNRLAPVIVPVGRGPEHFREIHRTAARLERTTGLDLSSLLQETQCRLPRDASVVVILQQVSENAALMLGMLRRQGFAVSAIVNHYEKEEVLQAAGRLVSQRIPVYHLFDESSIHEICRKMILKSS